jgi:hypothetical protein
MLAGRGAGVGCRGGCIESKGFIKTGKGGGKGCIESEGFIKTGKEGEEGG